MDLATHPEKMKLASSLFREIITAFGEDFVVPTIVGLVTTRWVKVSPEIKSAYRKKAEILWNRGTLGWKDGKCRAIHFRVKRAEDKKKTSVKRAVLLNTFNVQNLSVIHGPKLVRQINRMINS